MTKPQVIMTEGQEDCLWEKELFGNKNPQWLLDTVL